MVCVVYRPSWASTSRGCQAGLGGDGDQNRAGYPPVPQRLGHIRRDQRTGDPHRVNSILGTAAAPARRTSCRDLLWRDPANLVPRTSHAVAAVMPCAPDRRQRAIGRYRLDLQENSRCAMAPPAEKLPAYGCSALSRTVSTAESTELTGSECWPTWVLVAPRARAPAPRWRAATVRRS
jgi:hypothetical protein